jgi:sugar O-acyltransferase (sialic acid O-acetyltransferase NeuD family)
MRIVILGGGGHGAVVAEAVLAAGVHEVLGFCDDDPSQQGVGGLKHLGPITSAWSVAEGIVLGVGNSGLRRRWRERALSNGLQVPVIIHPHAWVSPAARLGAGAVVMAGAIIQARAVIGDGVIINTAASVDHDCRIGSYSHCAPGARLAGGVSIGEECMVGMMACVIEGRSVGAKAMIAAGAVVIHDVPDGQRVAGVPARPMDAKGNS